MYSNDNQIVERTKSWINEFVIGLNLCPFAKVPFDKDKITYKICDSTDEEQILTNIASDMLDLYNISPTIVETSFLILPQMVDFEEYLDYLEVCHIILKDLNLEGHIQIASFHPDYQFDGTEPDDVENYTNRSPYPMFHFLREESVERALLAYPEAKSVPETNIGTMNKMGLEKVKAMLENI